MINSLLSTTLSNAVTALALALAAMVVTRFVRRPAIAQSLWILVLVKLISPAVVELPLRLAGRPFFCAAGVERKRRGNHRLRNVASPRAAATWVDRSLRDRRIQVAERLVHVAAFFRNANCFSSRAAKFSTTQIVAKPPTAFFPKRQSRWQDLLVAIWLGGFAIWFGVVAFRVRQFRKWLRKTQPASGGARAEIDQLVREIGLSRPELLEVDGICPPLTWAMWGRPVVLLPRSLIGSLTGDERRTLLLHELAHLRRRDHWVRWLELIVTGLQWWQPLAWLARRKLHLASEQCCDAFVVGRFPELARTYAATLLKTVDFLADAHTPLPIGATGFGEARQLKRRLEMILKGCVTDRLSSKLWIGFALVALVVMPLSIRDLGGADQTIGLSGPSRDTLRGRH